MNRRQFLASICSIAVAGTVSALPNVWQYGSLLLSPPKKGGVAITLDDKNVDEWYSIRPLLNKYDAKATFFVSNLKKLTNDEVAKLLELRNEGHEIGVHGLEHLSVEEFLKTGGTVEEYVDREIKPAIDFMTKKGFKPNSFAYPGGSNTPASDEAILPLFSGPLRDTAYTEPDKRAKSLNKVYFDWDNPSKLIYGLGIDENYGNTIDELKDGLRRAFDERKVLVLYAHKPTEEPGKYHLPLHKLEVILQTTKDLGLTFYRASDLR